MITILVCTFLNLETGRSWTESLAGHGDCRARAELACESNCPDYAAALVTKSVRK